MTPPSAPLPLAPERARRPDPAATLTPAPKCHAILVPPIVLGLLATAMIATADAFVRAAPLGTSILRALVLAFAALVPTTAVLCAIRARSGPFGFVVATAIGFGFAAAIALTLPGPMPVLGVSAISAAAGLLAPLLWRPWQDWWTRDRALRVSLLTPSVAAAHEAIARLSVVPWVRVASVLVPGTNAELASQTLERPVASGVRGGPRLERTVIVSSPTRDASLHRSLAELVARGHDLTSETATMRTAQGRVDTSRADPLNLLLGRPRSRWLDASSRFLDIVGSLVLMLFASPLLIACAIAIVVDGGFPILYRQRRVGRGGHSFDVLKFRSMRKDAEGVSGPVWATEDDPRITRVGRFLRRYRLDELPQLWNVLTGSMALVGPRPERPHFVDVLREQVPLFELRMIVRPGLTGWAQVRLAYGASADDARSKLEYDLFYVARRSIWFDLAVLAETARVVLRGTGSR